LTILVDFHLGRVIIGVLDKDHAAFAGLCVQAFLEPVGTDVLVKHHDLRFGLEFFQYQCVFERGGAADTGAVFVRRANTQDDSQRVRKYLVIRSCDAPVITAQQLFEFLAGDDTLTAAVTVLIPTVFLAASGQYDDTMLDLNTFAFQLDFVRRFQRGGEITHEAPGGSQPGIQVQVDTRVSMDGTDQLCQECLGRDKVVFIL